MRGAGQLGGQTWGDDRSPGSGSPWPRRGQGDARRSDFERMGAARAPGRACFAPTLRSRSSGRTCTTIKHMCVSRRLEQKGGRQRGTYRTSSSSWPRNVMATPVFPARPVRPGWGRRSEEARKRKSASFHSDRGGKRELTDSVDVGLDRVGHLPVDDERHIGHIDTSTSLEGAKRASRSVRVRTPR